MRGTGILAFVGMVLGFALMRPDTPVQPGATRSGRAPAGPASPAGPPAPSYDFSNPRALPSMVTRWESAGASCAVVVQDATAYILRRDGLEARSAADGRVLWSTKLTAADCPYAWQTPLRVIEGNLLAGLRDRVFLVQRASGKVRWTVPLGGFLSRISGPPVAVVVGQSNKPYELLSLDLETGAVRARRRLPDSTSSLVSAAGTILATWKDGNVQATRALAPTDLTEIWSSSAYSSVREQDGVVYALAPDEECACDERFSVLDVAEGLPIERRPRRAEDSNNSTAGLDLPWDLQLVGPEHPWLDLRRNRREDGQPLWKAALPGSLGPWLRIGDSLFAHVDPGGRGLLLELDWNTGRVRRAAYGLRSVYEMGAASGVIVLHTEDAVVAVSAREFGPPEMQLRPVADEVRRILGGRIDYWDLAAPARELQRLGPEALPVLSSLIPSLEPLPLTVVANVVADAGYRPAASGLASRLQSLRDDQAVPTVLDALAAVGGPEQVAAIAARLDPAQPAHVRFSAFATLASVGTSEAVALLDAAVPQSAAPTAWWHPPSPEPLLSRLGQVVDVAAFKAQHANSGRASWVELETLLRARGSARTPSGPGRTLVVFPDGSYNGQLWAAELDESDHLLGPAIFLGVDPPGPYKSEGMPITVSRAGMLLEVRRADGAREATEVDLFEAARDSDQDGIPDLVERRLFLDVHSPDTDRDGIADGVDPVPNAAAAAADESSAAASAFFDQYYGIQAPGEGGAPLFVVADRALPRYGSRRPGIVLTAKETEQREAEAKKAGFSLPARVSLDPVGAPVADGGAMPIMAYTRMGREPGRIRPGERAFTFTWYAGPLAAAGYHVVMRKIGPRWYVRSFVPTWVS